MQHLKLSKSIFVLPFILCACQLAQTMAGPSLPAKPESLVVYIERVQRQYVRLSFGEEAHECFTDLDLRHFEEEKVVAKVATSARQSVDVAGIATALKSLPVEERTRWLDEARRHYHRTWAELGRITSDGSGQTWAGQRAEKMVASAIVAVVEEILASKTDASGQRL